MPERRRVYNSGFTATKLDYFLVMQSIAENIFTFFEINGKIRRDEFENIKKPRFGYPAGKQKRGLCALISPMNLTTGNCPRY